MAKSKHNTTKRGTQKQRARVHHIYMEQNHPRLYAQMVAMEYARAKRAAGLFNNTGA